MKRAESTDLQRYAILAGADDNAILAGRQARVAERACVENGGESDEYCQYDILQERGIMGMSKGSLRASHRPLSAACCGARQFGRDQLLKRWTGQYTSSSTTTGVQLDHGLWPLLQVGTPGYPATLRISWTKVRCVG